MALKRSSSPLAISTSAQVTSDIANPQFLSKAVDLQLNPLDNEVFVVTAVKIDFGLGAPLPNVAPAGARSMFQRCSISTTQQTTYAGIEASNVLAATELSYYTFSTASTVDQYVIQEDNAMDTPPADQDYLGIIATNDFFVNLNLSDEFTNGQVCTVKVRVYGYRAKADASTYAALVQSEVLSS